MAYNQNLVQVEEIVSTATTLTLGFGSGQTVPPRYLVCNPTGNMTVTLPLSTPALPTSSSTQYIPGAGPGYPLTIMNISSTPFTVTIAAASGDTLVNVPTLTTQNSSVSLFASPSDTSWYAYDRGSSSTTATTQVVVSGLGASSTSQTAFVADQPYIVTGVSSIWGTASSAGTMNVEKATGTVAVGSGTAILTAAISNAGAAATVNTGTLVATTATLTLASGNRLNILLGGTLTNLVNENVTIGLRKLA